MTPSARTRGGRQETWTRDTVLAALRRYTEFYGPDWTSASFNPSTAKWRDEAHLIERYQAGDPETGLPWPSLNTIKAYCGGSFNAARKALGLEPNRPGPSHRRPAGAHSPVRGVNHPARQVTIYRDRAPDDDRVATLQRALARSEKRLARAEANLVRARSARSVASPKPPKAKTVRVVDQGAIDRARARMEKVVVRADEKVEAAKQAEIAARARADEAARMTTHLAAKLERAEATITDLRADRRELTAATRRAEVAADAARAELTGAREEADAIRAAQRVIVKDAPEQAIIDSALAEARTARQAAHSAELRAAEAERSYREVAAAATGEPRRLTKAELNELSKSGPAGPALVAAALKDLAKARKNSNRVQEAAALRKLAAAAVSWEERL